MADYLYYDFPEQDIAEEAFLARLVLEDEPRFGFHEEGYGKLLEVSYVTLLVRAAQGLPLAASGSSDDSSL